MDTKIHCVDSESFKRPRFKIPALISCYDNLGETAFFFKVIESFRSKLDNETLNCLVSVAIDHGYNGPFITYHGKQVREIRHLLNEGFEDDSEIRLCR